MPSVCKLVERNVEAGFDGFPFLVIAVFPICTRGDLDTFGVYRDFQELTLASWVQGDF